MGPGQESFDAAIGMVVDDLADHIGQIDVRIDDAVEFTSLDQRSDDCPMLAAAVGSGEEGVLSVQRDGADAAFDHIGIALLFLFSIC
jgi:hypothetical protein